MYALREFEKPFISPQPITPLEPGNEKEPENSVLAGLQKEITNKDTDIEERLELIEQGLDKIEVLRIIAAMGDQHIIADPAYKNDSPTLKDYLSNKALAWAHLERIIPMVFDEILARKNPRVFWKNSIIQGQSILKMYERLSHQGIEKSGELYGKNPDAFLGLQGLFNKQAKALFEKSKAFENTIIARTAQAMIANQISYLNDNQLCFLHYFVTTHKNPAEEAAKALSCFHNKSAAYSSFYYINGLSCPYETLWENLAEQLENELDEQEMEEKLQNEKTNRTEAEKHYQSMLPVTKENAVTVYNLCRTQERHGRQLEDPLYKHIWKNRAEDIIHLVPEDQQGPKIYCSGDVIPPSEKEIKRREDNLARPIREATTTLHIKGEDCYLRELIRKQELKPT